MDPQSRLLLEMSYKALENGMHLPAIGMMALTLLSWHTGDAVQWVKDICAHRLLER